MEVIQVDVKAASRRVGLEISPGPEAYIYGDVGGSRSIVDE
jgi:hypothetical protein